MISAAFYAVYILTILAALRLIEPKRVVWPAAITGLAWLPPVLHPEQWSHEIWRVIGSALPSPDGFGKLAIVGAVLILVMLNDRPRKSIGEIIDAMSLPDWCMLFFCSWPIFQVMVTVQPELPHGLLSAAYLSVTWGALWTAGRRYLKTAEAWQRFVNALIYATLVMLPFAVFESLFLIRLHEVIVGPHTYATDGTARWLGYRPLLFFEHGNQYGIWLAAAALCAVWSWRNSRTPLSATIAALFTVAVLAAQSFGAILLFLMGIALLIAVRLQRLAVIGAVCCIALATTLIVAHAAGLADMKGAVLDFPPTRFAYDVLRDIGRGSFAWRFGQDLRTLPLLGNQAYLGMGRWDWFAASGTRPWGFPQLLVGQFGLVSVASLLLAGVSAVFTRHRMTRQADETDRRSAMVILLLIAAIDACLNSFLFYPAIAVAGGLVSSNRDRKSCAYVDTTPSEDRKFIKTTITGETRIATSRICPATISSQVPGRSRPDIRFSLVF